MRVLLGSGGFRSPERVTFLQQQMQSFFGPINRLLFIPYALSDHDAYVAAMLARGLNAGYTLDGIHTHSNSVTAIEQAEGVFVGGGNTFRLLSELYALGLLDVLRRRVRAGLPYLGISAGCNVACPTMRTTNDMPITTPPSLDALGLVPFQVNPHYFAGQVYLKQADNYVEHFGETRDERIREFHEMNVTPVVGLYEGGTLWCESTYIQLEGAPARVFRPGQPAVDCLPGFNLASLLLSSDKAIP